jgi:hypothetical protein
MGPSAREASVLSHSTSAAATRMKCRPGGEGTGEQAALPREKRAAVTGKGLVRLSH